MIHYGEEFKRFVDLLGLCELLLETVPQVFLQDVATYRFCADYIRIPSSHQTIAIVASQFVLTYNFARISIPSKLRKNQKEPCFNMIKKILWIFNLNFIIYLLSSTVVELSVMYLKKYFSFHVSFMILNVVVISVCIFTYSIPKHCFEKKHQAKVKCLMISFIFILEFLCIVLDTVIIFTEQV